METLIRHQEQPDDETCVSTVVAMILGVPVESVIQDWHDKYMNENASLRDILNSYGIQFESYDSADRHSAKETGYYILTVPSLNTQGGLHQILADVNADEKQWMLFDPQAGKEDKQYYTANPNPEDDLAVTISSYLIDAFIRTSPLIAE